MIEAENKRWNTQLGTLIICKSAKRSNSRLFVCENEHNFNGSFLFLCHIFTDTHRFILYTPTYRVKKDYTIDASVCQTSSYDSKTGEISYGYELTLTDNYGKSYKRFARK